MADFQINVLLTNFQTPSEQLNALNHQLLQKENSKYPKSQLSQPNGFGNGIPASGAMPSAGVTTKQLQMERQLVEQQSVNQELERRLQAVQESFKQARAHHDQEVQVQRQNADKVNYQFRHSYRIDYTMFYTLLPNLLFLWRLDK